MNKNPFEGPWCLPVGTTIKYKEVEPGIHRWELDPPSPYLHVCSQSESNIIPDNTTQTKEML